MSVKIQKLQSPEIRCRHYRLNEHVLRTNTEPGGAGSSHSHATITKKATTARHRDPKRHNLCEGRPWRAWSHLLVSAGAPLANSQSSHIMSSDVVTTTTEWQQTTWGTTTGAGDPVQQEGTLTGSPSDQWWNCSDSWRDVPTLRAWQLVEVLLPKWRRWFWQQAESVSSRTAWLSELQC